MMFESFKKSPNLEINNNLWQMSQQLMMNMQRIYFTHAQCPLHFDTLIMTWNLWEFQAFVKLRICSETMFKTMFRGMFTFFLPLLYWTSPQSGGCSEIDLRRTQLKEKAFQCFKTGGMLGDIQIFIEMIFLDWGMFRGIFRFLQIWNTRISGAPSAPSF